MDFVKWAIIASTLFLALAVLSFLLYFLLPNIVSFVMMGDPNWEHAEESCPAQQPIEPAYECKSEPEDPCAYSLGVNLGHAFCPIARQFFISFGAICLLLSLVSAAYHFVFGGKVKSGSRHP